MTDTSILDQFRDPAISADVRGPRRKRLQDRFPLDVITADARQAKPGRALLGLIGGLLFAIGWTAAKIFGALFFTAAWCFSAVKIGYRSAQGKALSQPSIEQLLAENANLRAELARVS